MHTLAYTAYIGLMALYCVEVILIAGVLVQVTLLLKKVSIVFYVALELRRALGVPPIKAKFLVDSI